MQKRTVFLASMPFGFPRISCLAVLLLALSACGSGGGDSAGASAPTASAGVPAAGAGLVALPQTGQITCTDATGATIACANTGQDGDTKAGAAWPNPRFTVDGSGDCITDNLTGLMWVRGDGGFRTWQLGLDFANNLDLCGFTDWRMPNRRELISLVNYGTPNVGAWLLENGFNFQAEAFYWSSSSVAGGATEAWILIVINGVMSPQAKSISNYVLPVRTGP